MAAVRSEIVLHPPPHVFFNTNPLRQGREQGGAALQEKDLLDVAAARLHGTAPSRRSLLALMWSVIANMLRRVTGATAASGHKAPTLPTGEYLDNISKTHPYEEQGGRMHAREKPMCRGRGEAARDGVGLVEPSRTATIDRTITLPSPGFESPVRFVGK